VTTYRIEIEHARRFDGHKRIGHGTYYTRFDGELIGTWRVPSCDAARWLLTNGHATRDDRLETCRSDGKVALSGSVGWFADHTVEETDTISPHWVKWKPFPSRPKQEPLVAVQDAGSGSAVADQSAFDDLAAGMVPVDPHEEEI
jgi:hypothetical protein